VRADKKVASPTEQANLPTPPGRSTLQERTSPVKVLYVGGYGRSGSTLLMRSMAQASSVTAVGELQHVWRRGFIENQLCGCGAPFLACDFWNAISYRAFGCAPSDVPADHYEKLQQEVHGQGTLITLRVPRVRCRSYKRSYSEYSGLLEGFYRAIASLSQSRLIIDSSKMAPAARMLSNVPGVELHLVHLVRDSRATAFSWQRHKTRTEIHWARTEMDRYGIYRSSYEWSLENSLLYLDRAHPASYTLLRYEDFVRQPAVVLAQLATTIGEKSIASELLTMGSEVWLAPSHTVAGNPGRFHSGETRIAADNEWESMMPARQRLLVTALTGPLLTAFGYPIGLELPLHLRRLGSRTRRVRAEESGP